MRGVKLLMGLCVDKLVNEQWMNVGEVDGWCVLCRFFGGVLINYAIRENVTDCGCTSVHVRVTGDCSSHWEQWEGIIRGLQDWDLRQDLFLRSREAVCGGLSLSPTKPPHTQHTHPNSEEVKLGIDRVVGGSWERYVIARERDPYLLAHSARSARAADQNTLPTDS